MSVNSDAGAETPRPPFPIVAAATGWVGPLVVLSALVSALMTFLVLAGLSPVVPTHRVVVTALLINAAMVAVLLAIIAKQLWLLWTARRHGQAGSRLHVRIVSSFSVIAAAPAIILAIVAAITLDRGLDRWFSERAQALIDASATITHAYLREQSQQVRGETAAMAVDLTRAKPLFDEDRERFRQYLNAQATYRALPHAIIADKDLQVVERARLDGIEEFNIPPQTDIREATVDTPLMAVAPDSSYIASLIALKGYDDLYLITIRPFDPSIVPHLRQAQSGVEDYRALELRRVGVQFAFALMYAVISLIVLLSAVWLGLNFAHKLVAPIRRLISAAALVGTGNLLVQVPVRRAEGDLALLGETFNTMTQKLRAQHADLVHAAETLNERRRFSEAVLAGVSAGVIGVDEAGLVTLLNPPAARVLGLDEAGSVDRPLAELAPELASLLKDAIGEERSLAQGLVSVTREGKGRELLVRVTSEKSEGTHHGYVVTLDDITDLVTAQRSAAWADIARRIAHEIKNPLTPIQLSAERLKRKYGKVIVEDRDIFDQCTDTIIRQVGDIGQMVDEFSAFARMPKPVIATDDVCETVRQVLFLQKVSNGSIEFAVDLPDTPMMARFDRRLVSQALTNIVKNATEAIAAVPENDPQPSRIEVRLHRSGDLVMLDVIDSGIGFPKENRSRLLEPYVTTREKGTGLGLAIVGRILEEHGGGIELHDAPSVATGGHGAWVRLKFLAGDIQPDQSRQEEKAS